MTSNGRNIVEINFDGIVGPSHNHAGLSVGNVASQVNAGRRSYPRAAALEGIAKMRANLAIGLVQGIFVPPPRPNLSWLDALGVGLADAPPHLRAAAMSASSMWAANAATVSPAADTADGRCHLTVANLITMPHRAHEAVFTLAQLRVAFAHRDFAVHPPLPAPFSDEGAANHLRFAGGPDAPGVEVFVYGDPAAPFPRSARHRGVAGVARVNRVERALFAQQSPAAIAAGAFHNDVVAVANGQVLFAHAQAFANPGRLYDDLHKAVPGFTPIEIPADVMSLGDAIATYLFNAQLVDLPDGGMALIMPAEVRDHPKAWAWLEQLAAGNGPIRRLIPVDVAGSMANGGGPACLRLRVACDPATVDPRFLVDDDKLDAITAVVERRWPEKIMPDDLSNASLIAEIADARAALLDLLGLPELSG